MQSSVCQGRAAHRWAVGRCAALVFQLVTERGNARLNPFRKFFPSIFPLYHGWLKIPRIIALAFLRLTFGEDGF